MSGDVRVRFGEVSARDLWSVRTTATGRRVYSAAESSKLARRLLREEAQSPAAEVTIEIPGIGGKTHAVDVPARRARRQDRGALHAAPTGISR